MAAFIFSKNMKKAEVFVKDVGAESIILTRAGKQKHGKNKVTYWLLSKKRLPA